MSKVVIDRAVVEQALECLEGNISYDFHGNPYEESDELMQTAAANLRAALEQPQVEQETKSYKVTGKTGEFCVFHSTEVKRGDMVYTHPQPPRQPLTEEQIKAIHATINWHEMGSAIAFARAIERAHGIGGEA